VDLLLLLLKGMVTDPALLASIEAKLKTEKLVIRSEAEEATFKENLLKNVDKDTIIKEEKKMWARRIEEDIEEATGIKKKPDELHHQYMKRVLAEKDAAEKLLKDKVEGYEKDGGSGSSVWKTKYEALEKQSKEAIAAKEAELTTLKKDNEANTRKAKLDEVYGPIRSKFLSDLPSYFTEYEKTVQADVLKKSTVIDGVLVMTDENGNPMKDQQLNNIKVETYLADKFKDVIKPDQQQTGAGTKPPVAGQPPKPAAPAAGGKFDLNRALAGNFATQSEVTEALGKEGLLQGTKEFDEAFAKIVETKNITKIF
jgi:hypothetical protein